MINRDTNLDELIGAASCDACAGAGDNANCMCGGSGKASDAVIWLREQVLRRNCTYSTAVMALLRQERADWNHIESATQALDAVIRKIEGVR